jgi:hypothetical protein
MLQVTTVQQQSEGKKRRARTSAILSLVLASMGIASIFGLPRISPVAVWVGYPTLVPILAIAGLLSGFVALVKSRREADMSRNRTLAIGGLVLSTIVLCLTPRLVTASVKDRKLVQQMSRFRYIGDCLDEFRSRLSFYPPSDALDSTGKAYCGAMKLFEALWGRDFHGFHPESVFRSDAMDAAGASQLYQKKPQRNNLAKRVGPFLNDEDYYACRLGELYSNVGPFDGNDYVICDIYEHTTLITTGKKVGMPVLYYKANTSKTAHDINDPDNPGNIYNYRDNQALLALGVPGRPGLKHPLYENPKIFYKMTRDYQFAKTSKPQRADSFILLSAGADGLYGTKDDIANFDIKWKPK